MWLVNPTKSANNAEITRRSSLGPTGELAAGASAVPQLEQNRAPASTLAPQLGQVRARELPHEAQKRAPSTLMFPQLEQICDMAADCMD